MKHKKQSNKLKANGKSGAKENISLYTDVFIPSKLAKELNKDLQKDECITHADK